MTKNNKPILSILIDDDKRVKFAALAKEHSLSMGYLVNQAIDRMLETGSINIYRESIDTPISTYVDASAGNITRLDVEELVKSYVDTHNSSMVSLKDVENLIAISRSEIDRSIASEVLELKKPDAIEQ